MYVFGLPLGRFVDTRGPRLGAFCGSILLGIGYFGLYRGLTIQCPGNFCSFITAYLSGPGSANLVGLCILSAFTGAGGCVAFLGGMKTGNGNTHPCIHMLTLLQPL
jgi:hypothetical protein